MNDRIAARRRPVLAAAAALSLLAASQPLAAAGDGQVRTDPSVEPGPATVRVEDGALHITLEEAIVMALEQNLRLRVERYGLAQVRLNVEQAMGIYDLGLGGGASASSDETPAASNLDGAEVQEQERSGFEVGISQLMPTGGTGSVSWSNGRFETNSQFSLLNPSFSSNIDFSLTQPLLRNFGRDATEFGIRVASLDSDAARENFVEQVVDVIRRTELAYWNLVAAKFGLRVAEESLQVARQLHEDNQVRVDVGTLAPLELVQSEAGIAIRDEEIIRARAAIGDAEDVLRYLLNLDDPKLWSVPVVADTEAEIEAPEADLDLALATALEARPELARERIFQRTREVEAAFYRQQTRPRLDLRATYGYNGVGGDVVIRDENGNVVGSSPGGWNDALDQITGTDFPGWSLGVEFGYPLQNRAARARATIASLAVEQGETSLEQLRQAIEAEVRIAVRGLETGRQEIASARVSVKLAEKNLDAERRKYENGLSTSFQILEVEEDLTSARSRLVSAVTGFRRALVEYHRAIGKVLESTGVAIVD